MTLMKLHSKVPEGEVKKELTKVVDQALEAKIKQEGEEEEEKGQEKLVL